MTEKLTRSPSAAVLQAANARLAQMRTEYLVSDRFSSVFVPTGSLGAGPSAADLVQVQLEEAYNLLESEIAHGLVSKKGH
ncbi:MAG TPA: hypothetical protein V6D17_06595 [Candidatus Obscuribacterales bacterium]